MTAGRDLKDANDKPHPSPPPAGQNIPETVSKQRGGNTVVAVDMVGTASRPHNDVTVPAVEDGTPGNVEEGQTNVDAGGTGEQVVWTRRDGLLAPPGIVVETETTPSPTGSQRGSDVSVRATNSPARSLVSRLKLPLRHLVERLRRRLDHWSADSNCLCVPAVQAVRRRQRKLQVDAREKQRKRSPSCSVCIREILNTHC